MKTSKGFKEVGIDISHWQGAIDFEKVKACGIQFVIIKAGGSEKGYFTDRQFENYYRMAKLAGLKVGAYYYAGPSFTNTNEGIKCAKHFRSIIKSKEFDYPVYIDIEEKVFKDNKKGTTDAVIAFCDHLEDLHYFVGIYSSDILGWKNMLEMDRLKDYSKWVARWGSKKPEIAKDFAVWQYSSTGHIDGIKTNVDLDVSLVDFAAIMHSKNLNRG